MLCAALGLGATGVAVANAVLEQQLSQQNQLLQVLQNAHKKLDAELEQSGQLQQQAADITQRRQQLLALRQQRHQTPALLQTLAQQTPAQITLRNVQQQKNQLTLSGNAPAPEDVMQLLGNLHEDDEDGVLRHAQLQELHADHDQAGYRFVIHAVMQTAVTSSIAAPP